MANKQTKADEEERIRAAVLRQARDIDDRKKLQARIADLVLEAFDLPSRADADPAKPQPSNATLFKQCLGLFQASDLDDLITERNVDDRCGYALCPRPNKKVDRGGKKVWNGKAGKDFELVDRAEMEKWCSSRCQERTAFVRVQLGTEPAWLRETRAVDIKLLDEAGLGDLGLADAFKVTKSRPVVLVPTTHHRIDAIARADPGR
jgi:RNA polymerase II-associated protein 2